MAENENITLREGISRAEDQGNRATRRLLGDKRYNNSQESDTGQGIENRPQETTEAPSSIKRKAVNSSRNQRRNNKRAHLAGAGQPGERRDLLFIRGDGGVCPQDNGSNVPWEHRGLLGQSSRGDDGAHQLSEK